MRRLLIPILVLLPCLHALPLLDAPSVHAADAPGLEGRQAPPWGAGVWHGTDRALQPGAFRGRVAYVVVLPQAEARAVNDLTAVAARYGASSDVAVVAIASTGAPGLASRLRIPVCAGKPGALDRAYGRSPRPWALAIDRRGILRYHGPALSASRAVLVLEALRTAGRHDNPLVGKPFGSLAGLRFHGATKHDFGAHALTLVRWWTVSCPHCTASVPDLAALRSRHRTEDVAFLPIYHFKGGRRWSPRELQTYLSRLGHTGPFAEDPGWTKLRDTMRRAGFNRATSVSFLVDARGIVRWAHPGPRVHASVESRYAGPDADLRGLAATVDALLAEHAARPRPGAAAPR